MYEKPSARYLISSKRSVKVNARSREMGAIGRLRRSVHTFWGRLKNEGLYTAETEDTYAAAAEKEEVSIRRRPIQYTLYTAAAASSSSATTILLQFYPSHPSHPYILYMRVCVCVCDRYPIFHLLHTYNPCELLILYINIYIYIYIHRYIYI